MVNIEPAHFLPHLRDGNCLWLTKTDKPHVIYDPGEVLHFTVTPELVLYICDSKGEGENTKN